MKDLNLIELYKIKKRLINEGLFNDDLMYDVLEAIQYKESMILEYQLEVGFQKFNNKSNSDELDNYTDKSNIKRYDLFIVENYNK